jgi:hypothetical protein
MMDVSWSSWKLISAEKVLPLPPAPGGKNKSGGHFR